MNVRSQYKRGEIPGPAEPIEAFVNRCSLHRFSSSSVEVFGFSPDWIEVDYSNEGLSFFEGGCTWIGEKGASIQLRKDFAKKKSYFGYQKEELLAHETVHLIRQAFEEPVFEEILAYQTSSSPFRRYFGPFFRNPKESRLFLLSLLAIAVGGLFFPLSYAFLLPLLGGGFFRLFLSQRALRQARNHIGNYVGKKNALPFLISLTDQEIFLFAKQTDLLSYAQKQTCLRWKQLIEVYTITSFLPKMGKIHRLVQSV
ncbi:MAG: hypothetical protein K940chlam9_01572 [Chlamydiae bacterium]|nr:hypothetical protein [Chlamydiota bacterium]